jgi:hypothetical protein
MKHGTSNRRSRNRGNGSRKNNKMQVFDSNGPDVRIRGTAHQICEKYLALAKDAASSGDKCMAENYLQHAEHYQRIINEWNAQNNRTESSDRPERKEERKESYSADKGKSGDDELGLPASILGDKVKADSSKQVQEKGAMEDA